MKPYILFLLHLPPPIHGSSMVGKYIKDSEVINNDTQANYINLLASESINQTGKINFKKIKNFISTWFTLFRFLLKKKPDLCYLALTTTGMAFFRDVLLIMLLKFFHIKRVYHLHNKGVSKKKDNLIYRIFYRHAFKGAKVILLSQRLYQDVEYFVQKSNTYICPNGVPEIKIKDKIDKKNRSVKVLFLSNLIESKGVFVLLEALANLNKKGLDFKCNIIGGEGDISNKLLNDKIQLLKLEHKVYYLGKKYGIEKHRYFSNSDIFVFPTFYENEAFSLVNIEAMQYSLPVISTDEGGIPDIVENDVTGYIVKKRSAIDLSNKIETLLKNKDLRKKMGEKGREKFMNHYRLENFENKLNKTFKTILNS